MTETGLSLGTPHYMSPEQATAENEITARSDVYSLGCVLYEMLTGAPPHVGASAQQIIMKIVTEEAAPVTKLRKAVPNNVAAAVAESLEKLPADRFESAKAFAEALQNPAFTTLRGGAGIGASGGPRGGVSRRVFAAVSALTVILLSVTLALALRSGPVPRVTRYSVNVPLIQPQEVGNLSRRIVITPDGSRLVYIGNDTRLWVRPLDALKGRPLEGTANAYAPFISPDGTDVGFFVQDRVGIQIMSLAGGPATTVGDSTLVGLGGAAWGPDGYVYGEAAAGAVRGLVRVPGRGGRSLERITTVDSATRETEHYQPVSLPNGRGILFSVIRHGGADANDVAVTVPGSGTHKILVRSGYSPHYAASGHLLYVASDGTLMAAPFDQDRLILTSVSPGRRTVERSRSSPVGRRTPTSS